MMCDLISCTCTARKVQRYNQAQIGNIVQSKIQSIQQIVRLYITSFFYRSLNNTPFKVILCTLIAGDIHG